MRAGTPALLFAAHVGEAVVLDFAIERAFADAQDAGGLFAIAVDRRQL